MGPTKIMIVRHAEKPGTFGANTLSSVNLLGGSDSQSLVTLGWERAGGGKVTLPFPCLVNHKHMISTPFMPLARISSTISVW